MLRLAALTALVAFLVTNVRVEAQEASSEVHTPSQDLQVHITQMEVQAQLSKLKGLFEKIAKAELELATVVGETAPEQLGNFVEKKEKLIESLRVESGKTQERIYQSAKALPQGYPLQLNSNANRPLSPDQAAQKLHSYSLKNSAMKKETPQQSLAVEIKYAKAQLIIELLWGVLREEERGSVGADERANLIILTGETQWIENARKLIETLDRCSSPNLKASEPR